jgi:serine/threonine-protein kinase
VRLDPVEPAEPTSLNEERKPVIEATPPPDPGEAEAVVETSRPAPRTKRAPSAPKTVSAPKAVAPTKPVPAPKAASTQSTGVLRINTRPWSKVSIDGIPAGSTPQMNIKVAAGTHTVTLENPEFGIKQKLTLSVKPGETVTRVLTLKP